MQNKPLASELAWSYCTQRSKLDLPLLPQPWKFWLLAAQDDFLASLYETKQTWTGSTWWNLCEKWLVWRITSFNHAPELKASLASWEGSLISKHRVVFPASVPVVATGELKAMNEWPSSLEMSVYPLLPPVCPHHNSSVWRSGFSHVSV